MSVIEDSSAQKAKAEVKEGFYLSEEGEWIPDGWTLSPLDEVGKITTGKTPTKANPHHWGAEVAFITPTDYNGCRSLKSPGRRLSAEGRAAFKNQIVPAESIAVSCIGSDMGKVVFLKEESLTNQQINCVSANSENDDLFWYYAITSDYPRLRSVAEGGGSTMPLLNKGDFSRLEFTHPPLPEQKAIAAVLGSLDDKIELLREQNETLETLAKTLFKRWFIDFNFPDKNGKPYKENGGNMIPSELGEIPEGWSVDAVSDHVDTISETFPLKEREEVIFLNTGDIQNGLFLHHNYVNAQGLPGQAKKSIKKGDILFSEIRPENHRHAYVYFEAPNHVVSTKLMVLRQSKDIDPMFTYFFMRQKTSIDHLQMMAESRSGTFPQITYDTLKTLLIAVPKDLAEIKQFTEEVLLPFFEKTQSNTQQIQILTNLRDTLLPKLMKGEIRIK